MATRCSIPFATLALAAAAGTETASHANPIRKVVMMLQNMENNVKAESKAEQAMYDNFMCYCKNGKGKLQQSIADGNAKIEALTSSIQAGSEEKAALEAALQEHLNSRAEANKAMATATALREKESKAFAQVKSDGDTNVAALAKAIPAIEQNMHASFLQTAAAGTLKQYAMEKAEMPDASRQMLLAFLSGQQRNGYVPQSGEIVGILKQMSDEMAADLKQATEEEQNAIQSYESLMAAKTKEVHLLQAQIEQEMTRVGETGVSLAEQANDLEDTKEALTEDTAFLSGMDQNCATKTREWEEIQKVRAEELVALAETIKVLNDDDALDLFKKTLPGASSFVQMQVSSAALRRQALAALGGHGGSRPALDFIALALQGKTIGFEKVISMIDEMVANLGKEQEADDGLKTYCDREFDSSDDKKKQLELSIHDSEKVIEDLKGSLATLASEIDELEDGVRALDKSVAEATDMRKKEHDEFNNLMTNNAQAKEVMLWAKNRLNKFYNPKLYKAPPKRELSAEDRLVVNMGGTLAPTAAPGGIAGTGIGGAFVQISAHEEKAAPGPAPEAPGAFQKKGEESNGVIAMLDLLIADLDKEVQEAEVSEKDAQADYETAMAHAGKKRAADSKLITEKETAKAEGEEALQNENERKGATGTQLQETVKYIHDLHVECDFLLKYYDARKEARDSEIDSLGKAKAVLNGADYSLLQTSRKARFLKL